MQRSPTVTWVMQMHDEYDVVIVGGGIHGCGIAQAAAAAGHTVLVLEQSHIAAGTSSRSSKLIHGGLRYLETMQLALVRQSLGERRWMLEYAPDLVRRVPFYIPVYAGTRRRPWQLQVGLGLYALLGGLGADNRFTRISLHKWDNPDGIETRGLQAVFRYYDGQTDDAALTRAVMRSAQVLGAELALPACFGSAVLGKDHVVIGYKHEQAARQCRARVLINAAGPWVNRVLEGVTPQQSPLPIDLVRGTHIRVRGSLSAGNWYMEAPQDGRAVFAMPRDGSILVGTTEATHTGDPSAVEPVVGEQRYLLTVLGHYFPYYRDAGMDLILSAYAGLRVLPQGRGSVFGRSRETKLLIDDSRRPRVLSVYGGKLTTWRATAARVMQRLEAALPQRAMRADTRKLRLTPD